MDIQKRFQKQLRTMKRRWKSLEIIQVIVNKLIKQLQID